MNEPTGSERASVYDTNTVLLTFLYLVFLSISIAGFIWFKKTDCLLGSIILGNL